MKRYFFAHLIACCAALFSASGLAAPEWLRDATIGGTYVHRFMDDAELNALLDLRQSENVSLLELDSRLSEYLTDTEFDVEVDWIDKVARGAESRGMKSVIYFPTLEVITPNGVNSQSSMYRDHPDWVQRGITGDANIFYGNQEVWVDATSESAWMSPNSPYKEYFIDRIKKLAATEVDGVWLDVPIYLDTGAGWAGAGTYAAADFTQWSIDVGIGGANGYNVPTTVNFNDAVFRAWVKWRHINLANFIEEVRIGAHSVNPDFAIIVENFPMDYMDATKAGLDATALKMSDKVVQVLETDSVSNELAMSWATPEDFESKITMLKWGKAINYGSASLSFSYGSDPLDAGLTLSSVIGTGTAPFESKTPGMLSTVDSAMRSKWFGYVRNYSDELLATPRDAKVGVWYSSASRDFQDFPQGGEYGMFSNVVNPNNDPAWWSDDADDSFLLKPHLGGYRGLSAALMRMHIPYKIVTAPGSVESEIENLNMLMLPSVAAMSDFHASAIKNYVAAGGVVLATGEVPGSMDAFGKLRSNNPLAELFGFSGTPARRVNQYGQGLAIYRPDILGKNVFALSGNSVDAAYAMSELEQVTRIHVDEPFTVTNAENVYIDHGVTSDTRKHLYLVNYSGLRQPIVSASKTVSVRYNAGNSYQVSGASLATPDGDSALSISSEGHGIYRIDVPVDQFALVSLDLSAITPPALPAYNGPVFADAAQQEAAESGLQFILDKMRNPLLQRPYNFGVHTNLLDNSTATDVYTNGHHVTGEHMGLLLRTAACMKNEVAYDQAYEYVRDAMYSPLYHVPNWSIDKFSQRPFVERNDDAGLWLNANAPLDDMRVIRGLLDGHEKLGRNDAESLAQSMLEGLYWTTVTKNNQKANQYFDDYAGGLLGFAWDWSEVDDASLSPPSVANGQGFLTYGLIPIDYQELGTMGLAAQRDHRWGDVLSTATRLLLDAEINNSGLFYNGYDVEGYFTGDFEYQGETQGEYLKTIQVLWQAIHLARVSRFDNTFLSTAQLSAAQAAATRSLNFYKTYYTSNNRVPEYMTMAGGDAPGCSNGQPSNCLERGVENLYFGEARIYAQIARLALLLDDQEFANKVINEKIMTDRISNTSDARYGLIGKSTTSVGDAEAWNVLESVFTLCLNASNETNPPINNTNRSPVAAADNYTVTQGQSVSVTRSFLLSNDTDADGDTLTILSVSQSGSQGGSLDAVNNSSWRYTPGIGVTGIETFNYIISDGQGGTGQGLISIQVNGGGNGNTTVVVVNPSAVNIQTGALNYGTLPFLTADDVDTYDIDSAPVGAEHQVVWTATKVVADPDRIASVAMRFAGHYSLPDVSQTTMIYNYATSVWDELDTRTVGDGVDEVVQLNVSGDYVSSQGEVKTRVRGVRNTGAFTSWANSLKWTVTYNDVTLPPITGGGDATSNFASGITLNGNLADWAGLQGFSIDPDDISGVSRPLDWKQAWMANDGQDFYLAYTNYGPVTTSWGQTIYFDTDNNGSTGWQSGLPFGADYVIQGTTLYRYAGNAAGNVWQWTSVTQVTGTPSGSVFEYRFPRSALGNAPSMRLAFVGSNEPYGGAVEDLYPDDIYDTSSSNRFFTYEVASAGNSAPVASSQSLQIISNESLQITLAATDFDGDALTYSIESRPSNGTLQSAGQTVTYQPTAGYTGIDQFTFSASDGQLQSGPATVAINVLAVGTPTAVSNLVSNLTIDGDLSDWQGLTEFAADPSEVTGALNPVDYVAAAMAHTDTSFYLYYENAGVAVSWIDGWAFTIYLDTDNNVSTGYGSGMNIGADHMLQGGALYQYTGDGSTWTWLYRGDVVRAVNGTVAEFMIDRVALGDASDLKLVLIGDNISINGSIEDLYPDGAYSATAAVRHLSYTTAGLPSQSQNTLTIGQARPAISGRLELMKNATQPTLQLTGGNTGSSSSGGGSFEIRWLLLCVLLSGLYHRCAYRRR